MSDWIEIDGSIGEGGGQLLRTALTLSILTKRPFTITNIRARRSNPGLQAQHLAAVKTAAQISQARIEGAKLGSQELSFYPGKVKPGRYRIDIGTAGSATLVLQTLLLPLSLAEAKSSTTICGGTHVPWSPSYHYLELQWLPHIQKMGGSIQLRLEKAGYYPEGGGIVHAHIEPIPGFKPIILTQRGNGVSTNLRQIRGISGVSNLDLEIAARQKHQALRRLRPLCENIQIKSVEIPAFGKGTFLILLTEFENSQACYCALGAKGKRAEQVADEACDQLENMISGPGAVDEYLADQLLLPAALAEGETQIYTARITGHLVANAEVIRRFLPVEISIQGELDQPGLVTLRKSSHV